MIQLFCREIGNYHISYEYYNYIEVSIVKNAGFILSYFNIIISMRCVVAFEIEAAFFMRGIDFNTTHFLMRKSYIHTKFMRR